MRINFYACVGFFLQGKQNTPEEAKGSNTEEAKPSPEESKLINPEGGTDAKLTNDEDQTVSTPREETLHMQTNGKQEPEVEDK